MTQLSWDATGDRIFEIGLDHGVLYPQDGSSGVPWNGLTGVTESPSGGEATPYYADGIKYNNVSSSEEFEGTIDAFTYPVEFEICDGTISLADGVTISQQTRESFGLSYRTLIGNNIDGDRYGYKLHLVYNILASPSDQAYETINADSNPLSFSWGFTTVSAELSGYKPFAHLVLDSTKIDPRLLKIIEQYLYGSMYMAARLLDPSVILEWVTNPPDTLLIDSNETTGLYELNISDWGDVMGKTSLGLYDIPNESRLSDTNNDGLYLLE